MKVKLQNDAGLFREVPMGLSWTGFLFTGWVLVFRGIFARGLIYLFFVYGFQIAMFILIAVASGAGDQESANSLRVFAFIVLFIPNVIFLFKVNKWTARYWMDRGYRPVGPGWEKWAPKIGLAVPKGTSS
ncbi:MAG TPA: hypothetical protein VNY07_10240 [Chthoniobacterales bacterium]|jgi:hypothetical protein|nr:hypothetical protein [Chthoniobacterales bacterium]